MEAVTLVAIELILLESIADELAKMANERECSLSELIEQILEGGMFMTETIDVNRVLVVVDCWCGIQHAVPEQLRDSQLRAFHNGHEVKSIYCPLGHTHVPCGEPEYKKIQKQLDRERAAHDQTRAALNDTEKARRAAKAANTRLKNRVAKGVCPCCHRSFINMKRHMATKHPDFPAEEILEGEVK